MARSTTGGGMRVKGPDVRRLGDILHADGVQVSGTDSEIFVRGKSGEDIGRLIAQHQLVVSELSPSAPSLEDIFFELTGSTGGPS